VVGSCECNDETSCSGATELVIFTAAENQPLSQGVSICFISNKPRGIEHYEAIPLLK
jgi:hypothetical protein